MSADLFDVGGLKRAIVLRTPARDSKQRYVCPECGSDIGDSEGTVQVPVERLEDAEARETLDGLRFPSHGLECRLHGGYNVVCPKLVSTPSASSMPTGWRGVPVSFADGSVRHVPIPERELEDAQEVSAHD